ncbi:MAG: hypothetical protein M3Y24_01675 [Acidobacteriota bacterium]|nr:hypothetical protein [Acidobacteriota bacterium]
MTLFLAVTVLASRALPAQILRVKSEVALKPKMPKYRFPGYKIWSENMIALGHKWCDNQKTYGFGWEADVWYYDGARIYFQIADYTHDTSWNNCALHIAQQYRAYVLQIRGKFLDGGSFLAGFV